MDKTTTQTPRSIAISTISYQVSKAILSGSRTPARRMVKEMLDVNGDYQGIANSIENDDDDKGGWNYRRFENAVVKQARTDIIEILTDLGANEPDSYRQGLANPTGGVTVLWL